MTEIEAPVPVIPALILSDAGTVKSKCGFAVTFSVKETVRGEGAPAVSACSVTRYTPAAVEAGTATDAVIFTGAIEVAVTLAPGVRLQIAFGIALLHETVTAWSNDPAAVT
jgi:hypothetical protein